MDYKASLTERLKQKRASVDIGSNGDSTTVYIRELSADEVELVAAKDHRPIANLITFSLGVVDEDGKNVYDWMNPVDMTLLRSIGFSVMRPVCNEIARISGISKEDVEKAQAQLKN